MNELSDSAAARIVGGFAWFPVVIAPVLVGAGIGVTHQITQAVVQNWAEFKAGFSETAI